MLLLLTTAFTCYLAGAVTGILVYRNNVNRLKDAEQKAKTVIDALKK
jgi:hypothetical protein